MHLLAYLFLVWLSLIGGVGPNSIPTDVYKDAITSGVYLPNLDSSSLDGRQAVECRDFLPAPTTAVIVVLGQSNAANRGQGRYTSRGPVYNFNIFDAKCYRARDPMLGATGNEGSPWARLGDKLVSQGIFQNILFVPIAVGGTSVTDWAPGGPIHQRLIYTLQRLSAASLMPTHILWHQGESDAAGNTTVADYKMKFMEIVKTIRNTKINAPIYLAVATHCGTTPELFHRGVRQAQKELVDLPNGIFPGPDTDTIGTEDRVDDCHMSSSGLQKHSELWFNAIIQAPSLSR